MGRGKFAKLAVVLMLLSVMSGGVLAAEYGMNLVDSKDRFMEMIDEKY